MAKFFNPHQPSPLKRGRMKEGVYLKNEKEMKKFGADLAKKLKGGEILALVGELGAGKTTFTQGLASGLGLKSKITSPTFVIMNQYKIQNSELRTQNLIFYHFDAYRLSNEKDLLALGIAEILNQPDTIVVIEWADKIKKILKNYRVIWLNFKIKGTGREIIIT